MEAAGTPAPPESGQPEGALGRRLLDRNGGGSWGKRGLQGQPSSPFRAAPGRKRSPSPSAPARPPAPCADPEAPSFPTGVRSLPESPNRDSR